MLYSNEIEQRVRRAIDELMSENAQITFYSVAERAQVGRSTLYHRDDLRGFVEAARAEAPFVFRANRLKELEAENVQLRDELAKANCKIELLSRKVVAAEQQKQGTIEYYLCSFPSAA